MMRYNLEAGRLSPAVTGALVFYMDCDTVERDYNLAVEQIADLEDRVRELEDEVDQLKMELQEDT